MTPRLYFSATAGLAMIVIADPAEAQRARNSPENVVRSCSNFGNGCTSAPTRRGSFGYEFMMPGGTWVSCRTNCKDAIREEMLDFWETFRARYSTSG